MEKIQKRFSHKTKFEFGDQDLKYTISDSSGSRTFSISYASIAQDQEQITERQAWFKHVGLLWIIIGIASTILTYSQTEKLQISFWFIIGFACLLFYRFSTIKFTALTSDKGKIFIIDDKNHNSILTEIESRRKQQIFSWYTPLNLHNDPTLEINKYRWLLKTSIISKADYDRYVAELCSHHNIQVLEPIENDENDPNKLIN